MSAFERAFAPHDKDWALIEGDCVVALRAFEADSFDAVVTDPPYELGFMGKKWDATGIAYSVDMWREVLRVLKPGGHLLAFGGTRTYHRMACAIEDAGFEVRDSLHWFYGSGFPKSLNLGDGRGTALKPGHEPVVLARKPLVGTVAANVAAHGTGALNIDGCRIVRASDDVSGWSKSGSHASENRAMSGSNYARSPKPDAFGRWPANVLLDEDAAAELDAQSGTLRARGNKTAKVAPQHAHGTPAGIVPKMRHESGFAGDEGGASRFFYCAKSSRKERDSGGAENKHPTVKPVELMRYLVRLVTPPGGTVLDPFTGSGTTGMAARLEGFRFVGVERDSGYAEVARSRIQAAGGEP